MVGPRGGKNLVRREWVEQGGPHSFLKPAEHEILERYFSFFIVKKKGENFGFFEVKSK